ncbi:MAG: hypothetical protein IJ909_10595 [Fibrobacter sp.]|nr:hypothetical protein [Fibrobacter sp.]
MKKINMKKLSLVSSLSSLVLLMACGDDITNDSVVKAQSYDSKADLPQCTEKFEGAFATIPSKKEVYVCSEGSWNSLVNNASAVSEDGEFACSTVELSNKKGYKVVCGGDSVAVVTNGDKGDTGDKGEKGPDGLVGEKGSDASGSNGRDLTLPTGDCAVLDAGLNYVVYDCGDSSYVRDVYGTSNIKTWNALNLETTPGYSQGKIRMLLLESSDGKSKASLASLTGDDLNASQDVSTADLKKAFAIGGTASLTVSEGATNVSEDYPIEPMVGVGFVYNSGYHRNVAGMGGLCITYTADKEMELMLGNRTSPVKFARVKLKAASKETTVNIFANEFVADNENENVKNIISSTQMVFVKAVGSLDTGTYTNKFAIYEFGPYGHCSGETFDVVKSKIKDLKKPSANLVDGRVDPDNPETYQTVQIGDQVWMAENLRFPYPYTADDGDDDPETHGSPMALCPAADAPTEEKAMGCLYSWAAAMDSASQYGQKESTDPGYNACGKGTTCAAVAPVQGICPDGWHLPSQAEINKLIDVASYGSKYPKVTRQSLGAFSEDDQNLLGFSAIFNGYTSNYTTRSSADIYFGIWSSTQKDNANVYTMDMSLDEIRDTGYLAIADGGVAVRCVQDQAKED